MGVVLMVGMIAQTSILPAIGDASESAFVYEVSSFGFHVSFFIVLQTVYTNVLLSSLFIFQYA